MSEEEIMQGINKTISFMKEELKADHSCFTIQELWAVNGLLDLYNKEKEKNKKVKKFCKEKSTFQTFGDEDMQYVLETYINRLKHRILDLLED